MVLLDVGKMRKQLRELLQARKFAQPKSQRVEWDETGMHEEHSYR